MLASSGTVSNDKISKNIKNLSTAAKSAKFKKLKLTKIKKSDFAKANFFKTDFFIFKAKKAFIHLKKIFTKVSILYYFDPKHYIRIETNALEYAIDQILSQITLDQSLSNYVIYENYSDFSKSEIS